MSTNNNNNKVGVLGDTTLTKVFVGGLAWETRKETLREQFEKFGEIVEAVIISDKVTGRSKGYGFVTFKEAEAANKACEEASLIINGRRANCNLASRGTKSRNNLQVQYCYYPPPPASPFHHQPQPQPLPFYGYPQTYMNMNMNTNMNYMNYNYNQQRQNMNMNMNGHQLLPLPVYPVPMYYHRATETMGVPVHMFHFKRLV